MLSKGLSTAVRLLRGVALVQNPSWFLEADPEFRTNCGFSAEGDALERESMHKRDQPKSSYALVIACSLGVVV